MFSPRWWQALHSLGLEFLLPLPLLGAAFWVGGGMLTDQVLSRPYGTVAQLQADTQLRVKLSVTVLVIKADIYKRQGFTRVEVKTANSVLKKLDFEFPVTQLSLVEARIAHELGLSRGDVRKLVRYHVRT